MDDRHYTYIRDEIACQASIRLNRTEQDENIPFLIFISHESLYRSIVAVGGLLEFKIERRRCCCCFTDTECLQLCSALSCLGLQPIRWFDTWAESLVCRTCFIKTRSHIWPTDSDHLLFTLSLSLTYRLLRLSDKRWKRYATSRRNLNRTRLRGLSFA